MPPYDYHDKLFPSRWRFSLRCRIAMLATAISSPSARRTRSSPRRPRPQAVTSSRATGMPRTIPYHTTPYRRVLINRFATAEAKIVKTKTVAASNKLNNRAIEAGYTRWRTRSPTQRGSRHARCIACHRRPRLPSALSPCLVPKRVYQPRQSEGIIPKEQLIGQLQGP